jgi:hypothetical protein
MRLKEPSILSTLLGSNVVDPVTRGSTLNIVNGLFFGLATIAIWTRFYARVVIRKWFGLDDWLIMIAWFAGCAGVVLVALGYNTFEWDRHIWDVHNSSLVCKELLVYYKLPSLTVLNSWSENHNGRESIMGHIINSSSTFDVGIFLQITEAF